MKLKLLTASIIATTALAGCSSSSDDPAPTVVGEGQAGAFNIDNVKKVLNTNADIALAGYEDSVETAKALQTSLATFKGSSTQANLDAAKKAWLVAREPYGQTEVYRFRLSPIDSTDYKDENGPEGDINAWPLGEALVDYVTTGSDFGNDQVGVTAHETGVADPIPANNIISSSFPINAELLSNTATADDERDVIAGYHAIEFLLWGQDLNRDSSADTEANRDQSAPYDATRNSGGQRPLTDFTTEANADRRHQFLEVAATKLIDDLEGVRDGWKEGAAYRTSFTTVTDENSAKQKLTEILTGMGTLSEGELAGERMQIAFSANSQEDEHSCFSDNTHRDIWLNAEGVSNSYFGKYAGYDSTLDGADDNTTRAVSGYGLDKYLADAGLTDLADDLKAKLAATEVNYTAIDQKARVEGTPVDVLIMEVNRNAENPMSKTILSLNAQSSSIAAVAAGLKIDGTIVVDVDASACDTNNPNTTCE